MNNTKYRTMNINIYLRTTLPLRVTNIYQTPNNSFGRNNTHYTIFMKPTYVDQKITSSLAVEREPQSPERLTTSAYFKTVISIHIYGQ
jgi:hypothetical protein